MDDGTTRHVYYGIRVALDGLTPVQLRQLLAIVEGSPYDGRVSNNKLVLEAKRPYELTATSWAASAASSWRYQHPSWTSGA